MPKLVNGEMTLSFGEATHPKILGMFGGSLVKGDPTMLVLKFPDVLSAASWANTCGLSNETHYAGYRMGCGPSFDDWALVEVMVPDA